MILKINLYWLLNCVSNYYLVQLFPGGLQYIIDGDARRNFQKQPLKVTILGVAQANFIP